MLYFIVLGIVLVVIYEWKHRPKKDTHKDEMKDIANSRMEHFNARLDKERQDKERWY